MKYLILILVLSSLAWGQTVVRAVPQVHEPKQVFNADSLNGTTGVSGTVLNVKGWDGAAVLWLEFKKVGTNATSTANVTFELKRPGSATWYHHYNDGDSLTNAYNVPAEKITNGHEVYVQMGDLASWVPADSVRFWVHLNAAADSATVSGYFGGH